MTTLYCLLKRLFPFRGYKRFVLECEKNLVVKLEPARAWGRCPDCKRPCKRIDSVYERRVRDLDMGAMRCYLIVPFRRIKCRCGYDGNEELDFVEKSHRLTKRLEARVVEKAAESPLSIVAKELGLDWKTVKSIDYAYLKEHLPDPKMLATRRIALDEIAVQKGQRYVTIVRDYDCGAALTIFRGRSYEDVRAALLALGPDVLARIERVSMDMWDPYIKAITELCPNATITFDKFHVVKKLNEALDTIRKHEFSASETAERKAMKHKRFLILKKRGNLDSKEREALSALLEQNTTLYQAYVLKEQLLSIFEDTTSSFEQIVTRLNCWFENILSSQLAAFLPVVNMIQAHLEGVLNYFRTGMTNGRAEGFNNKINVLKRRAYGFRDIEYFMLKIYQATLRPPA